MFWFDVANVAAETGFQMTAFAPQNPGIPLVCLRGRLVGRFARCSVRGMWAAWSSRLRRSGQGSEIPGGLAATCPRQPGPRAAAGGRHQQSSPPPCGAGPRFAPTRLPCGAFRALPGQVGCLFRLSTQSAGGKAWWTTGTSLT